MYVIHNIITLHSHAGHVYNVSNLYSTASLVHMHVLFEHCGVDDFL